MRKSQNLHINKVYFVPRKLNREHSEPKHILLKLLNCKIFFKMPKAFRLMKKVIYEKKKKFKSALDFFKAIIVDCSQVYVISKEKESELEFHS